MSEAEVVESLTPENFVAVRTIYGGPAPEETKRAHSVESAKADDDVKWLSSTREALAQAERNLQAEVDRIIG
jgi:hypothetical protein